MKEGGPMKGKTHGILSYSSSTTCYCRKDFQGRIKKEQKKTSNWSQMYTINNKNYKYKF